MHVSVCMYSILIEVAFLTPSRPQSIGGSVSANNVGAAPDCGQRQPGRCPPHHGGRPAARTAHCQRYGRNIGASICLCAADMHISRAMAGGIRPSRSNGAYKT